MKTLVISLGLGALLLTGCGSSREDITQNDNQPRKIDRAVVADFINNENTLEVESDNIHLSATVVPSNGNLAIRAHTDRRDLAHSAFYIDLDNDSSTGLQFSVRTNWRDQHAQADGEVGADLIVTDGHLYYFNRHERRWRYWFHSWQDLGNITYTRDLENGDFIIELPRNIATAYDAVHNTETIRFTDRFSLVPGDLDYQELGQRFDGHIRVAVELTTADWERRVESNERPLEYFYNPDAANNQEQNQDTLSQEQINALKQYEQSLQQEQFNNSDAFNKVYKENTDPFQDDFFNDPFFDNDLLNWWSSERDW